ncbi:MAG TPA: glutathione transferase GstA [Xanthomonadales bacterium]|nr:glutathione transferase GstA [Xanthomonadales bacterium]
MKLYYSPGACSMSPNIVSRELDIPLELVKTDIRAKKFGDGQDYRRINPKGYVPALELDDGKVLTEGPAIVQYLADLRPERQLAPPPGTFARYRLAEKLNFVSAELHKTIGGLFNPAMPAEWKEVQHGRIKERLTQLETELAEEPYLMGDHFTVVDAYAYTVLGWLPKFGVDIAAWPKLQQYMARVGARDSVKAAMAAEAA